MTDRAFFDPSATAETPLFSTMQQGRYVLERCAAMGLPNYQLFQIDPYLQSLRGDSRFMELASRLRREHDALRDEFGLDA